MGCLAGRFLTAFLCPLYPHLNRADSEPSCGAHTSETPFLLYRRHPAVVLPTQLLSEKSCCENVVELYTCKSVELTLL